MLCELELPRLDVAEEVEEAELANMDDVLTAPPESEEELADDASSEVEPPEAAKDVAATDEVVVSDEDSCQDEPPELEDEEGTAWLEAVELTADEEDSVSDDDGSTNEEAWLYAEDDEDPAGSARHCPSTQNAGAAHVSPAPHRQTPSALQWSAPVPHGWQSPPATPHCSGEGATHVLWSQQPYGQDSPLHWH